MGGVQAWAVTPLAKLSVWQVCPGPQVPLWQWAKQVGPLPLPVSMHVPSVHELYGLAQGWPSAMGGPQAPTSEPTKSPQISPLLQVPWSPLPVQY
jgi:hypothetical protein